MVEGIIVVVISRTVEHSSLGEAESGGHTVDRWPG